MIQLDQEGQGGKLAWEGIVRTAGLSEWQGWRWGVIPSNQDPRLEHQIGRPAVGRNEAPGEKKYTKDLRSSSRGEGWCGHGQKELGNICRQRGLFSFPEPLEKLLHNAGFLPQLRRPSI